jgi:hypothetical protein
VRIPARYAFFTQQWVILETRMVRVELTSEEAEELLGILDNYRSDLGMETVDTEVTISA